MRLCGGTWTKEFPVVYTKELEMLTNTISHNLQNANIWEEGTEDVMELRGMVNKKDLDVRTKEDELKRIFIDVESMEWWSNIDRYY